MKKSIIALLTAAIMLTVTACGGSENKEKPEEAKGTKSTVTEVTTDNAKTQASQSTTADVPAKTSDTDKSDTSTTDATGAAQSDPYGVEGLYFCPEFEDSERESGEWMRCVYEPETAGYSVEYWYGKRFQNNFLSYSGFSVEDIKKGTFTLSTTSYDAAGGDSNTETVMTYDGTNFSYESQTNDGIQIRVFKRYNEE